MRGLTFGLLGYLGTVEYSTLRMFGGLFVYWACDLDGNHTEPANFWGPFTGLGIYLLIGWAAKNTRYASQQKVTPVHKAARQKDHRSNGPTCRVFDVHGALFCVRAALVTMTPSSSSSVLVSGRGYPTSEKPGHHLLQPPAGQLGSRDDRAGASGRRNHPAKTTLRRVFAYIKNYTSWWHSDVTAVCFRPSTPARSCSTCLTSRPGTSCTEILTRKIIHVNQT